MAVSDMLLVESTASSKIFRMAIVKETLQGDFLSSVKTANAFKKYIWAEREAVTEIPRYRFGAGHEQAQ